MASRSLLIVLTVSVLGACGAARVYRVPPAEDLGTRNLDFEHGPAVTGIPPGWFPGNSTTHEFEWSVDEAVRHSGERSARIASVTSSPGGFGGITQCINPLKGVRALVYSGFLKTQQVAGSRSDQGETGAGLWMQVSDPSWRSLAFDNMRVRGVDPERRTDNRRLYGTSDWVEASFDMELREGAARICFGALLSSTGILWIDDLKLTPQRAD